MVVRLALVAVLLAGVALVASAQRRAPRKGKVYAGTIKDVRGAAGTLTLSMKASKGTKDRKFRIAEARFVGLDGDEIKVGDLREGNYVEVEMTADNRLVREVRVVKPPRRK
jgi:hypothetical protein